MFTLLFAGGFFSLRRWLLNNRAFFSLRRRLLNNRVFSFRMTRPAKRRAFCAPLPPAVRRHVSFGFSRECRTCPRPSRLSSDFSRPPPTLTALIGLFAASPDPHGSHRTFRSRPRPSRLSSDFSHPPGFSAVSPPVLPHQPVTRARPGGRVTDFPCVHILQTEASIKKESQK